MHVVLFSKSIRYLGTISGLLLIFSSLGLLAQQDSDLVTKFTAADLRNAPAELIPFPRSFEWDGEYVTFSALRMAPSAAATPGLTETFRSIATEEGGEVRGNAPGTCQLTVVDSLIDEAYVLTVTESGIEIAAAGKTGHFYGLQTLRQLIRVQDGIIRLPVCRITDEPTFSLRGFMIDVGRNFQTLETLKQQLDIMARYKLNTFQWHLTDRPAWRIESKQYTSLNAAENHRPTRDPGMFYTYDEIRELIAYARERYITVIPEIDMPGHSDAFTTATGVKMESEQGMKILEDVLAEFFSEIPAADCPVIHLGSDEVEIVAPAAFMQRMVDFCHAHDREVGVWNPGLPVPQGVLRQTWKPLPPARGKYREIDSWNSYINNGEPMTQVQRLFFKPIGDGSDNEVLGGILCLWPDVNLKRGADAFSQNPVYPSLLTYAWTTWTADVIHAPKDFYVTLPPRNTPAFEYFDAFERILLAHKERYFSDTPFPYLRQTDKAWKMVGPLPEGAEDLLKVAIRDTYNFAGRQFRWREVSGNTLIVKDRFRLGGYFPDAQPGETVYALTYIHADRDREVPTWVGFETPMRSNRAYGGIPEIGSWDPHGGEILINGTPLPPPEWQRPGWKPSRQSGWASPADQEEPWTEEELYWTRTPASISLERGWNTVLAKIPATSDYQNWMFTFVPLSMEGLRFSTSPADHSTYYYQRKTLFEILPNAEGEIVFLGDSMTDGGEWSEWFGNRRVKNRGISGDVTVGVLDRLREVTESRPAKVFLLIGTNDLARGISPAEVIDNIGRIVTGINATSPETQVVVQSIFPVNDDYGLFGGHTGKGAEIVAVNEALERGVEGTYRFIDLHSRFTGPEGKLDAAYTNDGLHLNGAGYRLWASLLARYLN